jgi:hypothetical protein
MQIGCLGLLLAAIVGLGGLLFAVPFDAGVVDATAAPMLAPTPAPSTPGPSPAS